MKKHISVSIATPNSILRSSSRMSVADAESLFESFKRQHHAFSQDPQNTKALQHFNLRLQEKLITRSILLEDPHSKSLLQHCLAHIALIHRVPLPLTTQHPLFKYTYDILNYLVSNSFITPQHKDTFLHNFVPEVTHIYARFIEETAPPKPPVTQAPFHDFDSRHISSPSTSRRAYPYESAPINTSLSFLNRLLIKLFSEILSATTLISRQNKPIFVIPRYKNLPVDYSKIDTTVLPAIIKKGFIFSGRTPSLIPLKQNSIAFWFTLKILGGLFYELHQSNFYNRNSSRLNLLTSLFLSDPFYYKDNVDKTLTVYTHVRAFHEEHTSTASKLYLQHSLHQSYADPEAEQLRFAFLAAWYPQQPHTLPPPVPPQTSLHPDASHWPRAMAVAPQPIPPFHGVSEYVHPAYQAHYPG